MFERLINIERMETAVSLFGSFDENIKLIEREFNVRVIVRGAELKIQGDVEDVMQAEKAVEGLLHLLGRLIALLGVLFLLPVSVVTVVHQKSSP